MLTVERKPNWDVWAHSPKVKVWEAICLSLNIDPRKVKRVEHGWMGNPDLYAHKEGQIFEDRIEIVRRNLGHTNGLRLASIIMGRPDYSEIYLAEFAQWAMSMAWDLPNELKLLAPQASTTPTPAPQDSRESLSPMKGVLTLPEKVTLAWMWDHVPVTWWWWIGTILVAVFAVGLTLGQSEFYWQLAGKLPGGAPPAVSQGLQQKSPGKGSPIPAKSAAEVPK